MTYKATGLVIGDEGLYGHIYFKTRIKNEIEDFKLSQERSMEYYQLLKKMLENDMRKQMHKWGIPEEN